MDNKLINYILIVIILLILSYYFKSFLVNKGAVVTSSAVQLLPSFNFIYV